MKKCVFAGTFDPPTIGHEDIVLKCIQLFDEVVVAVMINPNKTPLFTSDDRVKLLKKVFEKYPNVKVVSYNGLLVDLLKEQNTNIYVRGIRNGTDYDYETVENYINSSMYPELVTVYLPTRQNMLHISSSLVKDAIKFNKDMEIFLPEEIRDDVRELSKKVVKNNVQ